MENPAWDRHEVMNWTTATSSEDATSFDVVEASLERPLPKIRALFDEGSLAAEQLRVLRERLRTLGLERPMRRVGIVSASRGEGKTTLALGLTRAFALDPKVRVLLVEADLRRPSVDRSLGVEVAAQGLLQYLEGSERNVTLRLLVREGFYILSAGPRAATMPDFLGGPRMARLMDSAQKVFDYVVVDCPPLIPVADSLLLQDVLDGFVFVVRSRHAPRETVAQAIGLLRPDRVCGFVFNGHRSLVPGYDDYAYRRYQAT